jgi:hypothetical protein
MVGRVLVVVFAYFGMLYGGLCLASTFASSQYGGKNERSNLFLGGNFRSFETTAQGSFKVPSAPFSQKHSEQKSSTFASRQSASSISSVSIASYTLPANIKTELAAINFGENVAIEKINDEEVSRLYESIKSSLSSMPKGIKAEIVKNVLLAKKMAPEIMTFQADSASLLVAIAKSVIMTNTEPHGVQYTLAELYFSTQVSQEGNLLNTANQTIIEEIINILSGIKNGDSSYAKTLLEKLYSSIRSHPVLSMLVP